MRVTFKPTPRTSRDWLAALIELAPRYLQVQYERLLEGLGERRVVITVEIAMPEQTEAQRGYYHKMKNEWAKERGWEPNALHHWILCKAYGSEAHELPDGSTLPIPTKRSNKMEANRSDYSMLIETMIQLAAEDGYYIPEPNERAA